MSEVDSLLTDRLPNKWSKASAVLTVMLVPLAYNFPSIFLQTWLPNSAEQLLLIRLVLALSTALLGTLITLFLVIREYRKRRKSAISLEGWQRGQP